MFEFLMLIGFLGAGLCHWQPSREEKENAGSEKTAVKVNVKEEELPRETMKARIAAA